MYCAALLSAAVLSSCSDDGKEDDAKSLSADPTTLTFTAAGESKTFTIKAKNVSWTATSSETWLGLSVDEENSSVEQQINGTSTQTVTVTAEPNTTSEPRTAIITLKAEGVADVIIEVLQEAEESGLADVIVGNYPDMVLNVGIGGATPSPMGMGTIVMGKVSASSVSLSLQGFKFGEMEIPVSVADVPVTGSESDVTIDYTGTITAMGIPNIPITVAGSVTNGTSLDLTIDLTVPGVGAIKVVTSGEKQVE